MLLVDARVLSDHIFLCALSSSGAFTSYSENLRGTAEDEVRVR